MVNHAGNAGDRMAILDAPPNMSRSSKGVARGDCDVRLEVRRPVLPVLRGPTRWRTGTGRSVIAIPPSGHMAGIWARNTTRAACGRPGQRGRPRSARRRDEVTREQDRSTRSASTASFPSDARHPRMGWADAVLGPELEVRLGPPALQLIEDRYCSAPSGRLRAERLRPMGPREAEPCTRSC